MRTGINKANRPPHPPVQREMWDDEVVLPSIDLRVRKSQGAKPHGVNHDQLSNPIFAGEQLDMFFNVDLSNVAVLGDQNVEEPTFIQDGDNELLEAANDFVGPAISAEILSYRDGQENALEIHAEWDGGKELLETPNGFVGPTISLEILSDRGDQEKGLESHAASRVYTTEQLGRLHSYLWEQSLSSLAGNRNAQQKADVLDWIFAEPYIGTGINSKGKPVRVYTRMVPFQFEFCCRLEGADPDNIRRVIYQAIPDYIDARYPNYIPEEEFSREGYMASSTKPR